MKNLIVSLGLAALTLSATHASAESIRRVVRGVTWTHSGHSSPSDEEKAQKALAACAVKIHADVEAAKAVFGANITYGNVVVDSNYGQWSNTSHPTGGARRWNGGGVADCSYYVNLGG